MGKKQKRRSGHSCEQHQGQGQHNKQSDGYKIHTRGVRVSAVRWCSTNSCLFRYCPRLRNQYTMPRVTLATTRTNASQAISAPETWQIYDGTAPPARPPPALPGGRTCISQDARVPGSPSAHRLPALATASPAGLGPSASPRTPGRRSDTTTLASAKCQRALLSASGACASSAALHSHAPRSTKIVAPGPRSFQQESPPTSPTCHAVAVDVRCEKAGTIPAREAGWLAPPPLTSILHSDHARRNS